MFLVLAATVAAAPRADAATTCAFENDLLFIEMNALGDRAHLEIGGFGTILVDGATEPVICGPEGPPTVSNTETVAIVDSTDNPASPAPVDGSTIVEVVEPSAFAPGKSTTGENGGAGEIEFAVNMNVGSNDTLLLRGTAGGDNWTIGTGGINWNGYGPDAAPDPELTTLSTVDHLVLVPGAGNDLVRAQGGSGTGGAFPGRIEAGAGDGNDVIEGGNGASGDQLSGGPGNDTVRGFDGGDHLSAAEQALPAEQGDDTLDGGAGEDELNFYGTPAGVTVDLGQPVPQNTVGGGTDTITNFEDVNGTEHADTLIGNAAFNYLFGNQGDDTLDGGPNDDAVSGGAGVDTVTYARAPVGVTVDLITGATSGFGNDAVVDVENLIGSPFADVLLGSDVANTITGLGGGDTIRALAGPDMVDIRDGVSDNAGCGTELDVAIADHHTLDMVDPDCETVSFAPLDRLGPPENRLGPPQNRLGPPETLKGKAPKRKPQERTAKFTFSSNVPAATFECKLDRKKFKPCSSPAKAKRLKPGRHTFRVRAIAEGLADPTPAAWQFKVIGRKR
ncbi:MAG: calcium-binding protein [Solirubrobacterales bacterium]